MRSKQRRLESDCEECYDSRKALKSKKKKIYRTCIEAVNEYFGLLRLCFDYRVWRIFLLHSEDILVFLQIIFT